MLIFHVDDVDFAKVLSKKIQRDDSMKDNDIEKRCRGISFRCMGELGCSEWGGH